MASVSMLPEWVLECRLWESFIQWHIPLGGFITLRTALQMQSYFLPVMEYNAPETGDKYKMDIAKQWALRVLKT